MLKYFLQNRAIDQIDKVCDALNKTKTKLLNNEWNNPTEHYEECENLFSEIKEIALQNNDERLANSQFVFKCYSYYREGKLLISLMIQILKDNK